MRDRREDTRDRPGQAPESDPASPERIVVSAEEARQGRIVLTSRRRRAIFLAGLVGIVVVAVGVPLLLQ